MIELSDILIVDFVVLTPVGAILVFLVLLVLRIVCAKMKVLKPFAKLKIRYLALLVIAGSVLLSIGVAGILKVSSTRDISTLLRKLRTCSSIRVDNSYYDRQAYKHDREYIVINNRERIQELVTLIENAGYKRTRSGGFIDTRSIVDIYIYENGSETGSFRFILHILETGKDTKQRRYDCADMYFLSRVRQTIGAQGVFFDTE